MYITSSLALLTKFSSFLQLFLHDKIDFQQIFIEGVCTVGPKIMVSTMRQVVAYDLMENYILKQLLRRKRAVYSEWKEVEILVVKKDLLRKWHLSFYIKDKRRINLMLEGLLSHPEMFFLFLLTISVQLLKQSLKTIYLFDVSEALLKKISVLLRQWWQGLSKHKIYSGERGTSMDHSRWDRLEERLYLYLNKLQ